jgi:mRNA-degrading endonuclease YafQ of YafQ-DinJ toxin-antitoxin module
MRRIELTTAFQRDFKREKKGQYRRDLDSLVCELVSAGLPQPCHSIFHFAIVSRNHDLVLVTLC